MKIFGQRIHCVETGSGPPLILLHGLASDSAEWGQVSGPLARSRRVITPDQIGFGQSDKPMMRYRIGTLVSFLEELYRELRIERASLVAHGLSGTVAAAFALRNPPMVERLVLISAGFCYRGQDASPLNPATLDEARRLVALSRYQANDVVPREVFTETLLSAYANQKLIDSLARGEDLPEGEVSAIRSPTLIVWGREDRLTPIAVGERLHAQIPGAQFAVLEQCGHAPHREQPQQLTTVIQRFLTGVAASKKSQKRRDEENVWF